MLATDPCEAAVRHAHDFGQGHEKRGEARTRIVVFLTAAMMIIEIAAGLRYGSMALLADGLHMASHAVALGISLWAYAYARRHASDERFSFGTGKVHSLAGFTGAVLLGLFAASMAFESVERILKPVQVSFSQAILVAVAGLAVNAVSALLLIDHEEQSHHHDHNVRSAYLHVLADALTSVLAIAALAGGRLFDWWFLDPLMGIVGAVLVARWSGGLLRDTARVLLDRQDSDELREKVRNVLEERPQDRVADLHVWRVAPEGHAAVVSIISSDPLTPLEYRKRLAGTVTLMHLNVEVHRCEHGGGLGLLSG
jgi:cation diffusion facilitator family transporter